MGYSYLSAFKGRAAYAWATETTIYVKETNKRMGIGGKLYRALENAAKCQNILNLNACIAYPDAADEFLTRDSVAFHQRCGYREVGEFRKCGYKFDRWYNIVWMEKLIGTHGSNPLPVLAFPTLDTETLQAIGITQ